MAAAAVSDHHPCFPVSDGPLVPLSTSAALNSPGVVLRVANSSLFRGQHEAVPFKLGRFQAIGEWHHEFLSARQNRSKAAPILPRSLALRPVVQIGQLPQVRRDVGGHRLSDGSEARPQLLVSRGRASALGCTSSLHSRRGGPTASAVGGSVGYTGAVVVGQVSQGHVGVRQPNGHQPLQVVLPCAVARIARMTSNFLAVSDH